MIKMLKMLLLNCSINYTIWCWDKSREKKNTSHIETSAIQRNLITRRHLHDTTDSAFHNSQRLWTKKKETGNARTQIQREWSGVKGEGSITPLTLCLSVAVTSLKSASITSVSGSCMFPESKHLISLQSGHSVKINVNVKHLNSVFVFWISRVINLLWVGLTVSERELNN